MVKVKIYGMKLCSYCTYARDWFAENKIDFEYIEANQEVIDNLEKTTGIDTVPQIFINDKFIGGWIKTKEMIDSGELQKLLK